MELRRDGVLDQPLSTDLTTDFSNANRRPLTCRSVFDSSTPQRLPPCPLPPPRTLYVQSVPISYGGRTLGPTTYDVGRTGWVTDPKRKASQFASRGPRLHQPEPPLSAKHDFLSSGVDTLTRVSKHAMPLSRATAFTTTPREPVPLPRDEGQEAVLDPQVGSIAARVTASSHSYRSSFRSGQERLCVHKTTTARELGPGAYDTSRHVGTLGRPLLRSQSTESAVFRAPKHSKAALRPLASHSKLPVYEAYGGEWLRAGSIDPHWTARGHSLGYEWRAAPARVPTRRVVRSGAYE